jgi:hypothetical protein
MSRTREEPLAKRNELMARDINQVAQIRNYGVDLETKRSARPPRVRPRLLSRQASENEMPPHTVL